MIEVALATSTGILLAYAVLATRTVRFQAQRIRTLENALRNRSSSSG